MTDSSEIQVKNLPIMIDCLKVPGVSGMIGLSSCPGLRDDYVFDLYCESLVDDVQSIKGWGASVVITLMDYNELKVHGVADLGRNVIGLNMVWLHLPIMNASLPDQEFNARWETLSPCLCNILKGGNRILIHCREGIGRTALVAAKLLVDLGLTADETVKLLRKTRPGSLLLYSHEQYVYSYAEKLPPFPGFRGDKAFTVMQ
jgi:ADP-ribosyl-[dinitrogen reductase] hydrolase